MDPLLRKNPSEEELFPTIYIVGMKLERNIHQEDSGYSSNL